MKMPDRVQGLFNRQDLVAVGTSSPDGVPNVVPIFWKKILDDETIIMIDNFMKATKENIQRNESICISFWDAQTEEAYKLKGTATYHLEGPMYEEGKALIQAEKPDRIPRGVVEVQIREIFRITPGPKAGSKIES